LLSNDKAIFTEQFPSNDREIFTEPLPSNDKAILTEQLPSKNRGIFTEQLPSKDTEGDSQTNIQTYRQQRDLISLLYFLAYFPYFEKINYAYEMTLLSPRARVCVCIPLLNF
jgi:hypothetical protein